MLQELFVAEGFVEENSTEGLESLHERIHYGTRGGPIRDTGPTSKGRQGSIPARGQAEPNRFSIGMPIVHPLQKLLTDPSVSLPATLQYQLEAFEFFYVQLACSFRPASGHQFEAACFQVDLLTHAPDPTSSPGSQAIAYAVYPEKTEDESTVIQKVTVTPELKLSANPFEASLPLPGYERSSERITYAASIEAFGLQDTRAGWSFRRTASRELSGVYTLFLLVRKPKGTLVKGVFNLSARVQTLGGGLSTLFMKYRRIATNQIVDDPTCSLC